MSNTVLLMYLTKNSITVSLCYIWTHHDNLTVVLLSQPQHITQHIWNSYGADYNTDFTIGLLFLTDGTIATMSVCAITVRTLSGWLRQARLWCDRRRRRQSYQLGDSRRYCIWSLFDAQCFCAWPLRLCSPLYNKWFSPFSPVQPSSGAKLTARLHLFYW